jgi:hypothetical protein
MDSYILRIIHIEKELLKRIFVRKEVTEGWRELHNEELHNLYSSPNIIRVTKSRMIRWAGHVTFREKCIQNFSLKT